MDTAHSGIGVEFAILSNHVLTVGNVIDVVTQTVIHIVDEYRVGPVPSTIGIHATLVQSIVVEALVPHLVIFLRAGNHLVVRSGALVATPLGIYCDDSLVAFLCFLGGDKYHTVTTTGTIKGGGSGVLQHGDALHIDRVDVVETTIVRRTIDNNQRSVACIDGVDTTNTDARCATWLTRNVVDLDTRSLTLQSVDRVGHLHLVDIIRTDNCGRSCQ